MTRWLTLLRAAVTLQAAALLIQAVTAGRLLSGEGRSAHAATAVIVTVTVVLQLIAAVLYWRLGRGNPRILVSSVLQLAFVVAEFLLADAHNTLLHVPIGVLLFGFSMLMAGQAWQRPQEAPA